MAEKNTTNLRKTFRGFFRYIGSHKVALMASVCLSVIGSVLTLIGPGKIGDMTDLIKAGLSGSMDIPAIGKIAVVLAVIYLLCFLVNYVQGFIMATVTQRITQSMRRDISEKIDRMPLKYFDAHTVGDTLSRVTNDVDTVGQTMNQCFSTLIFYVAMLFGATLLMLTTNWVMAICGILAAIVGFAAVLGLISKSQNYFIIQQQELGAINGCVEENYTGLQVIKAYNGEQHAQNDFTHETIDFTIVHGKVSSFLA